MVELAPWRSGYISYVVIVGSGFAGLYAAKCLQRQPVHVTVLDRRNYHLFQSFLYQVATTGLSPGVSPHPFALCCVINQYQGTIS
jgi:NADH dehydrogenase FAD-containing subunit